LIEEAHGFGRFSQRGQAKVRREWALGCLTPYLLKLFRHRLTVGWAITTLVACTA